MNYDYFKKYMPMASIGLQFSLSTVLGILIGYWLDQQFDTKPWIMVGGLFFGLAAGINSMIKELKLWEKNNADEDND